MPPPPLILFNEIDEKVGVADDECVFIRFRTKVATLFEICLLPLLRFIN